MDKDAARKAIKRGGSDPAFRRTNEYKDAIKYTNAHYKGMLRGTQNTGGGGYYKKGCSLWTCLVLVALVSVPTALVLVIK